MNTPATNRLKVQMDLVGQTVRRGRANDGGMHESAGSIGFVRPWPCLKDHAHDNMYEPSPGRMACRICEAESRKKYREEHREQDRLAGYERKRRKAEREGKSYPKYRPGKGHRGAKDYA